MKVDVDKVKQTKLSIVLDDHELNLMVELLGEIDIETINEITLLCEDDAWTLRDLLAELYTELRERSES